MELVLLLLLLLFMNHLGKKSQIIMFIELIGLRRLLLPRLRLLPRLKEEEEELELGSVD